MRLYNIEVEKYDAQMSQAPAPAEPGGDIKMQSSATAPVPFVSPPTDIKYSAALTPEQKSEAVYGPRVGFVQPQPRRPPRPEPPAPPRSVVEAIQRKHLGTVPLDLDIRTAWDRIFRRINENLRRTNSGEILDKSLIDNFRRFQYETLQQEFERGQVERWLMEDTATRQMDLTTETDEKEIKEVISAAEAGAKAQESEVKELKRVTQEQLQKIRLRDNPCQYELKLVKAENKQFREQLSSLRIWTADLLQGWNMAREYLLNYDSERERWFRTLRETVFNPLIEFLSRPVADDVKRDIHVLRDYATVIESWTVTIETLKQRLLDYEAGRTVYDRRLQTASIMLRAPTVPLSHDVAMETKARDIEAKITAECRETARRYADEVRELKVENKKLENKNDELQMRISAADAFNAYARAMMLRFGRVAEEEKKGPAPIPAAAAGESVASLILRQMPTFYDVAEIENKWAERIAGPTIELLDEKYSKQYSDTRANFKSLELQYKTSLDLLKLEVKQQLKKLDDYTTLQKDKLKLQEQLKTAQTMINRLIEMTFVLEQFEQPAENRLTVQESKAIAFFESGRRVQLQEAKDALSQDFVNQITQLEEMNTQVLAANWQRFRNLYVDAMRLLGNRASNLNQSEWKSISDQYVVISQLEQKFRKELQDQQKDYIKRINIGESNLIALAYALQERFYRYIMQSETFSPTVLRRLRNGFEQLFMTQNQLFTYSQQILSTLRIPDHKTTDADAREIQPQVTRVINTLLDGIFQQVLPPTEILDPRAGFSYGDVRIELRDMLNDALPTIEIKEIRDNDISTIRQLTTEVRAANAETREAKAEVKKALSEQKECLLNQTALANLRHIVLQAVRDNLNDQNAPYYGELVTDLKEGKVTDKMVGQLFQEINKRLRGQGGGRRGAGGSGGGGGGPEGRPAAPGGGLEWKPSTYNTLIAFYKLVTSEAAAGSIKDFVHEDLLEYEDIGRQRKRPMLLPGLPEDKTAVYTTQDQEREEEKRHDTRLNELKVQFDMMGDGRLSLTKFKDMLLRHLTPNGWGSLLSALHFLESNSNFYNVPIPTMMASDVVQLNFARLIAVEYKQTQLLQGGTRFDTNMEMRNKELNLKRTSALTYLTKEIRIIGGSIRLRPNDGLLGTKDKIVPWNTELWERLR
jgi:hypothetical protein